MTGIEEEFRKLDGDLEKELELHLRAKSIEMVKNLQEVTPVDTGLARDSWTLQQMSKTKAEISNLVPYIEELNAGSSTQAPAYFVEKVALKYGRPEGTIVQILK